MPQVLNIFSHQELECQLEEVKTKSSQESANIRKELEEKYEEARQQAERATEALRNNLESSTECTESLTEYKCVHLHF